MKKFEEYFSIIYILGGFLIPICIVLLIYYTFVGKSYYNVSSKNEETISMLLSQVTEIKEVPKGFNIGYSNAYKTNKKTKVAIIPCGYINGVDVQVGRDMFRPVDKFRYIIRDIKDALKKQGHNVNINGQICEILGRIGTFHVTVDITGKDIKVGDKATFEVNTTLVNSNVERVYE